MPEIRERARGAASAMDQKHGHISRCAPPGGRAEPASRRDRVEGNARSTHVSRAPSHRWSCGVSAPRGLGRRTSAAPRRAARRGRRPSGMERSDGERARRVSRRVRAGLGIVVPTRSASRGVDRGTRQPCDAGARDANADADGSST